MRAPPIGLAATLLASLLGAFGAACGGGPPPNTEATREAAREAQLERARAHRRARVARAARRRALEAGGGQRQEPFFRRLYTGLRWEPAAEEAPPIDPARLMELLRLPEAIAARLPPRTSEQEQEQEPSTRESAVCRPISGLASLAFPGAQILACVLFRRGTPGPRLAPVSPEGFGAGCRIPHALRYDLLFEGGRALALSTPAELGRALAPIESEAEALGLVALAYGPEMVEPAERQEQAQLEERARRLDWRAQEGAPQAYEVEAAEGGFLVRFPVLIMCGRSHPILRLEVFVSREGALRRTERPFEMIAAPGRHAPIVD